MRLQLTRGVTAPIPIYRVAEAASVTQVAEIELSVGEGCTLTFNKQFEWPLVDSAFDGIPYFIDDMRPQGFLGRQFARRQAEVLRVPVAPEEWADDHILAALTTVGADQVGNYIVGNDAYRLFLDSLQQDLSFFYDDEVDHAYALLADEAMAGRAQGALVGGEFPKFTARRFAERKPCHVIVKFAGADNSPASQRWSDLLVCEHLASCILRAELGVDTARSSIYQSTGRTFLEVIRFDRHGAFGRSPVCSWASVNAGLIGLAGDPWPKGAARLQQAGWLAPDAAAAVEKIWHFGRLIANTDMHDGNLSFVPGLALAPIYDMLPMGYAPARSGEIADRDYLPQLPPASEREAWIASADAAIAFWRQASCDERISAPFRAICRTNGERLASVVEQA